MTMITKIIHLPEATALTALQETKHHHQINPLVPKPGATTLRMSLNPSKVAKSNQKMTPSARKGTSRSLSQHLET